VSEKGYSRNLSSKKKGDKKGFEAHPHTPRKEGKKRIKSLWEKPYQEGPEYPLISVINRNSAVQLP